MIGTLFGVYFGVKANNDNDVEQDTQMAIHLLKISSEDTEYQSKLLKNLVTSLNEDPNMLPLEKMLNIKKSIDGFEHPDQNIPYPVVFDKVVNEYKVYSRLSYVGMRSIYRIQESLNQEKAYVEGGNTRLQEFKIANGDYPPKEFLDSDQVPEFVDMSVRTQSLIHYQKYLDVLSSILNIQVRYLKGEISESQADKITLEIESKIFLGDSEPLDREEIEQRMDDAKRKLQMLNSENTLVK